MSDITAFVATSITNQCTVCDEYDMNMFVRTYVRTSGDFHLVHTTMYAASTYAISRRQTVHMHVCIIIVVNVPNVFN